MRAAPRSRRAGTTLAAAFFTDKCSSDVKRLRTQSTGTGRSSVACSCPAFAQWKGVQGYAAKRAPAAMAAGRLRHGSDRVGHFRTPLHWETLEHTVFPFQLVKSFTRKTPTDSGSRVPWSRLRPGHFDRGPRSGIREKCILEHRRRPSFPGHSRPESGVRITPSTSEPHAIQYE